MNGITLVQYILPVDTGLIFILTEEPWATLQCQRQGKIGLDTEVETSMNFSRPRLLLSFSFP